MDRALQILLNVTMTVTAALAFSKLDVDGPAVNIQDEHEAFFCCRDNGTRTSIQNTKKYLVLGIDLFLGWANKRAVSFC